MKALIALLLAAASVAEAQEWTGVWVGGTTAIGEPIFIQAEITSRGSGLVGMLEVPAQDAMIPMEKIQAGDGRISFELPTPYGLFRVEGALEAGILRGKVRTPDGRDATLHLRRSGVAPPDMASFVGTFISPTGEYLMTTPRKHGQLRLIREKSLQSTRLVPIAGNRFLDAISIVKDPAAASEIELPPGRRVDVIDQEPVTFHNGPITLAGTLFKPRLKGPHAAAVVVHGSGAVTRDMLLARAQLLMRMGLAVLLYDKRGTGESEGDWRRASFEDLAADALAAVRYFRTRHDIDQRKLGVVGHSQAGWIIPIVTSRDPQLAFAIIASGGGVSPEEQEIFRSEAQTRDDFPNANAAQAKDLATVMWRYARTGEQWESYEKAWQAATKEPWFRNVAGPRTQNDPLWHQVRLFASYDPLPYLESLTVPTLVILGADDKIHPTKRAAEIWKKTRGADVIVVRRTGHNLAQRQKDGSSAYAPHYLEAMRKWLQKRGVKITRLF